MIIKGNILNENFEFKKGEVHIENDTIKQIIFNDNITDEDYIVPGFIDTHMHGAMGDEFFNCNFEPVNDKLVANEVVSIASGSVASVI